jgi:hypothetical protein
VAAAVLMAVVAQEATEPAWELLGPTQVPKLLMQLHLLQITQSQLVLVETKAQTLVEVRQVVTTPFSVELWQLEVVAVGGSLAWLVRLVALAAVAAELMVELLALVALELLVKD